MDREGKKKERKRLLDPMLALELTKAPPPDEGGGRKRREEIPGIKGRMPYLREYVIDIFLVFVRQPVALGAPVGRGKKTTGKKGDSDLPVSV